MKEARTIPRPAWWASSAVPSAPLNCARVWTVVTALTNVLDIGSGLSGDRGFWKKRMRLDGMRCFEELYVDGGQERMDRQRRMHRKHSVECRTTKTMKVATTVMFGSTGDLTHHDMGSGLPFRPATFDACISISALHWLCYSNSEKNRDRHWCVSSLSLYNVVMKRGGRAVLRLQNSRTGRLD
jgi:hypothetical protein